MKRAEPATSDRLEVGGRVQEKDPGEVARGSPDQQTFQVAMTGAFLAGSSLRVRIDDYGVLQAALGSELRSPGWKITDRPSVGGTYETGGGFDAGLPLVVARREGHELVARLRYELDGPDHSPGAEIARRAPGYRVEANRMSIDVYDLGVAVLTAWFRVATPEQEDPAHFMRTMMRLAWLKPESGHMSVIPSALQTIARETVAEYNHAVRVSTSVRTEGAWLGAGTGSENGRLLWLHPVHVLEAPAPSTVCAEKYAPVFHRAISAYDAVFSPGINWSVIVAAANSDGASAPVQLIQLHWAYYALYMERDRVLMGVLNTERLRGSPPRKQLAHDAERAFAEYLRVAEARARLDSELSSLGGDNLAIWQAIADVQQFDILLGGVERKIDVLQRLTQRRADQAAAERARRISTWLGSLAALTVITATIAAVAYFAGATPAGKGHSALRVVAFVLAALAALVLLGLAYRAGTERGSREST